MVHRVVPWEAVVAVAAGDVVEVGDREYFGESWPYWEIGRVRQLLVAAAAGEVAAAVKSLQVDVDLGEVLDSHEVGWRASLLAVGAVRVVRESRLTTDHQTLVESDEDYAASLQVGQHHWSWIRLGRSLFQVQVGGCHSGDGQEMVAVVALKTEVVALLPPPIAEHSAAAIAVALDAIKKNCESGLRVYRGTDDKNHTCVYNIASSGPVPFDFAVNSTQNTLHHLLTGFEDIHVKRLMSPLTRRAGLASH